jgi:hypothetical protein
MKKVQSNQRNRAATIACHSFVLESAQGCAWVCLQVDRVRDAAMADPTLTPSAALLKTHDYAWQKATSVLQAFDRTRSNLDSSIAFLETELAAPVTEIAGERVSVQVRDRMMAAEGPRVAHGTCAGGR